LVHVRKLCFEPGDDLGFLGGEIFRFTQIIGQIVKLDRCCAAIGGKVNSKPTVESFTIGG
jgi:hypothetical protein